MKSVSSSRLCPQRLRSRTRILRAVVLLATLLLLLLILHPHFFYGYAQESQPSPDADNTVTRIHVYENGSARWAVQIRTRLATEDNASAYRAFQRDFRNDSSGFLTSFEERMTKLVNSTGEITNREMVPRDFRASTSIQQVPRRWGVVTYEFVWTNFTAPNGESLTVGDVFEGGFFIEDGDRLQVVAPETHKIASASPEPLRTDNGTVTWEGRRDFTDGHPRVVFAPGDDKSPSIVAVAVILVVFLVLVAGGGYTAFRRFGGWRESQHSRSHSNAEEIVTDEQRVLDLLKVNGGKMKQSVIVDELGWSKSKTSRVISKMEDEEMVTKLQLGRENVIEVEK